MWDAVLGELQLQVPKPSYETWLRGTTGVSVADGALVVRTPNAFVSEMLDTWRSGSRSVEKSKVQHALPGPPKGRLMRNRRSCRWMRTESLLPKQCHALPIVV